MVKIVNGKRGFHLQVDGLFIYFGFNPKAPIASRSLYHATQWVSIGALRNYWKANRREIVKCLDDPHISFNGSLMSEKDLESRTWEQAIELYNKIVNDEN